MTTSSDVLVRPLDRSEAIFADAGVYVSNSIRFVGRVDDSAVAEAFDMLRRAYPILSCRTGHDADGRAVLETGVDLPPVVGHSSDVVRMLELGGRTAAVYIAREGDGTTTVRLLAQHAIADGRHALRLLADLWSFYTATVDGVRVHPDRHGYPQSLEQLLFRRGITADLDEAAALPDLRSRASDRPRSEQFVGMRTRLTKAQTRALVEFGHRRNVTINGLVSAALLHATADIHGMGVDELIYLYPVDLRTRLLPRVGDTEGTNVLGMALFIPEPGMAGTVVQMARAVTGSLATGLATGDIQRSFLRARETGGAQEPFGMLPDNVVHATNWGEVPDIATPTELEIVDFHPGIHSTEMPEAIVMSRLGNQIITTFDGRLTIDAAFPVAHAEQLADRLRELLTHLDGAE